jgi:hypothetical protein
MFLLFFQDRSKKGLCQAKLVVAEIYAKIIPFFIDKMCVFGKIFLLKRLPLY